MMEQEHKKIENYCVCCEIKEATKEAFCELCWCWIAVIKNYTNIYKEGSVK